MGIIIPLRDVSGLLDDDDTPERRYPPLHRQMIDRFRLGEPKANRIREIVARMAIC